MTLRAPLSCTESFLSMYCGLVASARRAGVVLTDFNSGADTMVWELWWEVMAAMS